MGISFDCKTGPSDIIENNVNGLLIEDQNMSEMQEGLIKLMQEPNLRKTLSQNGINSLDKYSVENIAMLYEELISKIVNK